MSQPLSSGPLGPESELLVEIDENIVGITINRPKVLNALNRRLVGLLDDLLDRLAPLEQIQVVVLTGTGEKAFAAGAEIGEMLDLDRAQGEAFARTGQSVFEKIERLPQIVVAAVNGYALGGGCELAMACDIRIAAEHARFGQPEINLGLIPGYGGTQRLPRLIGRGRALEILLTGEMLDARRAQLLGLVERVVPSGTALKEATDLARGIAGKGPLATAAIKRAVTAGLRDPIGGYETEMSEFGALMETDDKREGITAFLDKRPPSWKGR